jgi:riboflavin synthase
MFTGIIEATGAVTAIQKEGSNIHFTVASLISDTLKIDQSLCHDGVCLTVVAQKSDNHTVTAVEETLKRTNLGTWEIGTIINLERAMLPTSRLDGHIVQGHVDCIGECIAVEVLDGSWYYKFQYQVDAEHILVDKGSICINGVSLTVVNPIGNIFTVSIIPYTFEHTNFKSLKVGDLVNLEFDVIGKYISKYMKVYRNLPLGN